MSFACLFGVHYELRDMTPEWCEMYRVWECSRGELHVEVVDDECDDPLECDTYERAKSVLSASDLDVEDVSDREYTVARRIVEAHQRNHFSV